METENVQAHEMEEQEVFSPVEEVVSETTEEVEDDYTPPTKAEYKKLQRQAYAYQALKGAEAKPKVEPKSPAYGDDKLRELELRADGYSKDEIELVKEFGLDKIDNPLVQKAIDVMRKERKSKEADVAVSSKSAVYQKFSVNDLKNMSVEEMREILPHAEN